MSKDIPHIIPNLTNTEENRLVEFDKDDLPEKTKKTLGDYVSKLTIKNEFPIKEGSVPTKLHNQDGTPAEINIQNNDSVQKTYFDTFTKKDVNTKIPGLFQKYSNSGFLDTKSSPFVVKKGISNN